MHRKKEQMTDQQPTDGPNWDDQYQRISDRADALETPATEADGDLSNWDVPMKAEREVNTSLHSFTLLLDRAMTPADEDAFDHAPEFAGGDVSLLLSGAGQPTQLLCDVEADSEEAAVAEVTARIARINGLRVTGRLPLEALR